MVDFDLFVVGGGWVLSYVLWLFLIGLWWVVDEFVVFGFGGCEFGGC